jgi:S1-C subfamily serine protease
MLKKLSKSFLKRLVLIKLVLITVVVSLFISVKGPELHHSYLRSVVASKVVYVFSDSSGRGGGTGFFIKTKSGKFKVLTNKHICESSKDKQFLYIKEEGEPISRPYRIYVMDEKHDLCLVDYDKEVPVLSFASSIDVGEIVA